MTGVDAGSGEGWAEALAARLGRAGGSDGQSGEQERAEALGARSAARRAARGRSVPPVPEWARRVAESGGFDSDGPPAA